MKSDPLAGLRDIHMPDAVSWWPPAIGWWGLMLLSVLSVAALLWWLKWRKAQRQKPKQFSRQQMLQQALNELENLNSAKSSPQGLVTDLSALLRRVAMRLQPEGTHIAGLSGQAWANWLDEQWHKNAFVSGAGRAVLDAPYQRDGQFDVDELIALAREWIEAQR